MDDILKKYWWIQSKERTQNIDMLRNQVRKRRVTELFNRGRKLNIPLVFVTQSSFTVLNLD